MPQSRDRFFQNDDADAQPYIRRAEARGCCVVINPNGSDQAESGFDVRVIEPEPKSRFNTLDILGD